MSTGVIIPADPTQEPQAVSVRGLRDMQAAVGGYIEAVELEHPLFIMLVNEEGLVQNLPVNTRATAMVVVHGGLDQTAGYVAGDVLLVGPTNRLGYFTSVPKELYDILLVRERFDIEVITDDANAITTIEHGFKSWTAAYEAAVRLAQEYDTYEFKVRVA